MKKVIISADAPAPIGPYSQAIRHGNMVFVSGQIALHPVTGMMMQGSLQEETRQVLENVKAVLAAAGVSMDHVVKSSIFLMDMNDFGIVNEVYGTYFLQDPPARETVQVAGLPKGARVEISVIAVAA